MYRQLRPIPSILPKIGAGGGDFRHGLFYAKLFYFFFFAAIGCLVPYLNVYFAQKGLSGAQIGWLGSVAPMIALTANPIWGGIADRWQVHRTVLALCAVGAGLISLFYLVVDSFWPLMLVTVVLTFFRTPIGSLLDSSVLDMVRRTGGHYGRQRMWGSVGFVLVTLGLGSFITLNDLDVLFWVHGLLLALICGALAMMLPIGAKAGTVSLVTGLRQLTQQRGYLSFLGAMALLGIGTSSYVNFVGLHMLEIGGNQQWLAWSWAANGLTEAPMMFLGARWFARFRYSRLLQIGFAGYMVVWALMALAQTPVQLTLCAAANGICYGTLWAAAVNYAGESAPPGLSATAQALVGAAQSGVGWSLGSVLAGYLWDAAGGPVVFVLASGAALLAGLLFWIGNRKNRALTT
jgi:MFS family permease